MVKRDTIRVRVEYWQATSPRTFEFVAWRVTVIVGNSPGDTLGIDAVNFPPGSVIRVGGRPDGTPVLWSGIINRAIGQVAVIVETLDPSAQ